MIYMQKNFIFIVWRESVNVGETQRSDNKNTSFTTDKVK